MYILCIVTCEFVCLRVEHWGSLKLDTSSIFKITNIICNVLNFFFFFIDWETHQTMC